MENGCSFITSSHFDFEAPAPADYPTFYNCGESSHSPPKASSIIHPPSGAFKNRKYSPQQECRFNHLSSVPAVEMTHENFEQWAPFDQDVIMDKKLHDKRSNAQASRRYTRAAGWPRWDSTEQYASIPASAARSSIECTVPQQYSFGDFSPGDRYQQHTYGPFSPSHGYGTYAREGKLPHHLPPHSQPHNTPNDFTLSSLSSSAFPLTSHQMLNPPMTPVSPLAFSIASSSSSCSPSSSPELTVHKPIPLHQPRPSRRIPIISLSELASACDDISASSEQRTCNKYSQELLSPLVVDFPGGYAPAPFSVELTDNWTTNGIQFANPEKYTLPYYIDNCSRGVVCSCGCMESYTMA